MEEVCCNHVIHVTHVMPHGVQGRGGVRKRTTSEADGGRSSKAPRVEASRKISEFFRNSHSTERKRDASVQVLSSASVCCAGCGCCLSPCPQTELRAADISSLQSQEQLSSLEARVSELETTLSTCQSALASCQTKFDLSTSRLDKVRYSCCSERFCQSLPPLSSLPPVLLCHQRPAHCKGKHTRWKELYDVTVNLYPLTLVCGRAQGAEAADS